VVSYTLVGTLDYGSLRVATATMGYKHQDLTDEQARAEICKPTYMLKIMPGYDGKPRICELACTTISEIEVKSLDESGPATVVHPRYGAHGRSAGS
jgi:acetoacetate decarboxylase